MVLSSEKDNKMEMNKLLIIGGRKGYKALQKRDLISKPFFFSLIIYSWVFSNNRFNQVVSLTTSQFVAS